MTVSDNRERLAGIITERRSILTAANGADLQDNPRTSCDQLEREARAPNDQLARETRVADRERFAAATAAGGNATPGFDRKPSRYSRLAAARNAAEIGGEPPHKNTCHAPAYLNDGRPRQ